MVYSLIQIEAETIGEAWEKAVVEIMKRGHDRFVEAPEYKTWSKDSPMIIVVSDPMKEPRVSPKSGLIRDYADIYTKNFIEGIGDAEKENSFDYTYYSRLRHYKDCEVRAMMKNISENIEEEVNEISGGKCVVKEYDQIKLAIDTLKKDPSRRSVVLATWIVARDSIKAGLRREKTSSPCLVTIHPQIIDGRLHFFVTMKTNDLYNGWPENAYAFTALQKHMADELGVGIGTYTHFSISMHIYEEMYEDVKKNFGTG